MPETPGSLKKTFGTIVINFLHQTLQTSDIFHLIGKGGCI